MFKEKERKFLMQRKIYAEIQRLKAMKSENISECNNVNADVSASKFNINSIDKRIEDLQKQFSEI